MTTQFSRDVTGTFALMERLNGIAKHDRAQHPFGDVAIVVEPSATWVLCPRTMLHGFCYQYDSLEEAVAAWNVEIVAVDWSNGDSPVFMATPKP